MFDNVSIKEVEQSINFAEESSIFEKDRTIPDLQIKGVTALCKILSKNTYAYLADEVGMGKTYQAIGVISMLLKEKKDSRILIIAPNEAVQDNWRKELNIIIQNNILFDIELDMEKDIKLLHPVEIMQGDDKPKISILRLSSFSTIGEKVTKIGNPEFVFNNDEGIDSEQLAEGIRKVIGAEALELEHGKSYSSYEAGMICGKVFNNYSQRYDLVIVDEAQNIRNNNNATVFFNYWMGLKRFKPEACMDKIKMEKSAFVRHECKYLLLSATPAHRGVESLRKQLLYFEDSMNIGDISHDFLKKFMIRRLKTYNGKNKYAVRKIKADDVAKDLSIKQRMFLALVQSKLAQLQASNNATFKIGFLETFESYDVKKNVTNEKTASYEGGKEFENGGSAKAEEKGAAIDKQMLSNLAKSYSESFKDEKANKVELPPHPKLDYMEKETAALIKTNLRNEGTDKAPDKAIVFVRRLASVDELVNNRLNRQYENTIIKYWGDRFKVKDAELNDIKEKFEALYSKHRKNEKITDVDTDEIKLLDDDTDNKNEQDDKNIKSELLLWLKKSEENNKDSCISLFKKSMMKNRPNSFMFEENYYRTVHFDESEYSFDKNVYKLVDDEFVREVGSYIEADRSHYVRDINGKRQYNNSYLLGLCCYLALAKEENPLAECIKNYFEIKEAAECKEIIVDRKKILSVLRQTSLWNCCRNYTKKRNTEDADSILINWFVPDKFNKREALKSIAKKYLISSEAVLEILYCYCNFDNLNDKKGLCTSVCKALYSKKCTHGLRVSTLFEEENAQLVYKELSADNDKINYKYNPSFMDNQQWVISVTGGNKDYKPLIKRFNTPFYPDIIVCTDVLKEGINLHLFCNRVYHYGLAWTPGDIEQRVGRVDRLYSKTHRRIAKGEEGYLEVRYPYMGKSVDENQLRKVLQFNASADPLLDESGTGTKDIDFDLSDACTLDELVEYVYSGVNKINIPYSGERFWKEI